MWSKIYIFSIFAFLSVQYDAIYAKRILVISSIPSYSHQISYRGVWLELNRRGHEIVSITPYPVKNSSLTNYTEIDLSYILQTALAKFKELTSFDSFAELNIKLPLLTVDTAMSPVYSLLNEELFKNPEVKKLYAANSNEHFDAVIVEQGLTPSLSAFAYRFNAPLIGISSLDVFNDLRYALGSFVLPSHSSNWQTNIDIESNMPFWKRLVNFYDVWKQIHHWINTHMPAENMLVEKYLGPGVPTLTDIIKNMSIYLVNKHPAFAHVRSENPNVIFYHGSHIAKTLPPLPKNLKRYLDDAKEGFIYVSLGTLIEWEHLSENALASFIETFSALPYKIVWKYDPDMLPRKFENILASKWFPQQSILAHPNIKLFIYQGGVQSTEEAIYYQVPLVGFPLAWDQKFQIKNIVRLGIGVYLDYKTISKENVQTAVNEVLNNKRYKDQVRHLGKLYKDLPYENLDNAIWWVEYVLRHNGTSLLRNSLCDDPWYQRYDWDIIGFFAIVAFTTFLILLCALFQILRFIHRRRIFYRIFQGCYTKSKTQ